MKLIRSFPAVIPAGRNYVVDDAARLVNRDYSYAGLVDVGDDLIHLDWDTAVSREDLVKFAQRAQMQPQRVLVAPVKVYPDSRRGLTDTIWNCRLYDGGGYRYVNEMDVVCDLFGFGMVYLPKARLAEFAEEFRDQLADGSIRFDDTGFAGWYDRTHGQTFIEWAVRPIHLHYRISEVPL